MMRNVFILCSCYCMCRIGKRDNNMQVSISYGDVLDRFNAAHADFGSHKLTRSRYIKNFQF